MAPVITLLTDFGSADTYVGQMKGAILAVNRRATLVDLTHEVRPQQVRQGAFLLETALAVFPADTIHLAVVDPGVGGARLPLAIGCERGLFVGPDNGLLSAALRDEQRPTGRTASMVAVPEGMRAVALRDSRFHRSSVSATFHGRDIFGPVAGYLSLGAPLASLGPAAPSMVALPPFRALPAADGNIHAQAVSIDRFGNVITDCRAGDLPSGRFIVSCAGRSVPGPVRTYDGAAGLIALIGSAGYLEIALSGGSAAATLGVAIGAAVTIAPST